MAGDSSRLERLDARAARRWAMATRAAFAAHRAEIDDVNVFPVPDGDTGTNLYMTLDSALEAARKAAPGSDPMAEPTLAGDAAALARATLLAARGNSGVILSQLVRGLSEVIAEAATTGVDGVDGPTLAVAVRRASDRAYAGVTRPVEGTILSVASAAASAAELAAATGSDLYAVAHASLAAARVALAGTTAQLASLSKAGVVDAGGMGYVLVLEALERVIAGELATDPRAGQAALLAPVVPTPAADPDHAEDPEHVDDPEPVEDSDHQSDHADRDSDHADRDSDHADRDGGDCDPLDSGGPAYEVMYLLSDSDEGAVSVLREQLDALGDSVLVVGGEDIWNVHVHVDDVGAVIEAGIQAGRPHRVVVTHFGDQQRMRAAPSVAGAVAVVAWAAGEGLAEVFREAGAVVVFNEGLRASAGQLLEAIRSARSRSVLVLPNDTDTQLAAEAAASAAAESGLEVHVVSSQSAVQGIAALAVFAPGSSAEDNLAAMSAAAVATRHGAVTVASKEAQTSAGSCHPGDVLGVVDGDVVAIGKDLAMVGADVVALLLGSGGELLTVISGAGAEPELAALVATAARERHRDVEVSVIEGGQAVYLLLLGVE